MGLQLEGLFPFKGSVGLQEFLSSLCSWWRHTLGTHVPKETREHRDLLVVTELALSASRPLHCAIWCMALIAAHSPGPRSHTLRADQGQRIQSVRAVRVGLRHDSSDTAQDKKSIPY
ncbi:unnamed protein product [Pleuronectes platessa]|uniref:Uncharacterized protein n=1 Tax=Pleuronectes platessa TaxID=8262 RepID=A0A9N7YPL0_PLEPL|nr:unnamed protein product [Pleuronectes platessa]